MLVITLSAYTILVCILPIEYRHPILYINPFVRGVDFIIGIYLFLLYRKISTKEITIGFPDKLIEAVSLLTIIVAIIISCIASKETVLIAAIYWLPLSALMIFSVIKSDIGGKIYDLLVWIGNLSFPMFLTHQIVIRYVHSICRFIGLSSNIVSISISFPLIFLAAWICDKYFLNTVSLWLKKRKK